VVCGEDGVSDFDRLHSLEHDLGVFLYTFDLLVVDGTDIPPIRRIRGRADVLAVD